MLIDKGVMVYIVNTFGYSFVEVNFNRSCLLYHIFNITQALRLAMKYGLRNVRRIEGR